MNRTTIRILSTAVLTAFPLLAFAHPGHAWQGFADGFSHPFGGADHLLAMLAVGLWGGLHPRRAWLAPLCFAGMLGVGGILGQILPGIGMTEPLVALSVLVLGLMLCGRYGIGNAVALAIIGVFALFHGMAHGAELPGFASALAGMVFGSSALHAVGIATAQAVLRQRPWLARIVGQAVALAGGGLLIAAVA